MRPLNLGPAGTIGNSATTRRGTTWRALGANSPDRDSGSLEKIMGLEIRISHLSYNVMPDSFFAASKPRKRKRSTAGHDADSGSSKKFAKKAGTSRTTGSLVKATKSVRRKRDEELDSDQTNEEDGGIDDMDLRHGLDAGQEGSGDEDVDETPAEKRLRLAQLYLDSIKDGLGTLDCSNAFASQSH